MSLKHKLHLPENVGLLLSPKAHPPALSLTRCTLITVRIERIASLFAFLTFCWIGVDAFLVPAPLWQALAYYRTVVSFFFVLLKLSCSSVSSMPGVYSRLLLLFIMPVAFLLNADHLLHSIGGDSQLESVIGIYSYAPFAIAAGISIFPLTLAEAGAVLIAPVMLLMALFSVLSYGSPPLSMLWILLLIMSIASLSALSQMGLLLRMFDDTAHDSLTGLYRRAIGSNVVDQQFQAMQRQKAAFSLLILDIDNFRRLNDELGHYAGDMVLEKVAGKLKAAARRQDIVIRWGGGEFMIALPSTDISQARIFIQRLAAEGFGLCHDGRIVTASIGVAESRADKINDWEKLAALAAKRLAKAKKAGRNRYVLREDAYPMPLKTQPVVLELMVANRK